MSVIKFIRGQDIGFLVSFIDDGTTIDVSDGTWYAQASLRYQTDRGPSPFDLTTSLTANGAQFEISSQNTAMLRTDGTGYVLIIRASKNDGSLTLTTLVDVKVEDDIF